MKEKKTTIFVNNPDYRHRVLVVGIPFTQGYLSAQEKMSAFSGRNQLPLWFEPRSFWRDGSLRWAWVHLRVPPGESEIYISKEKSDKEDNTICLKYESNLWHLYLEGQSITINKKGEIIWKSEKELWNIKHDGLSLDGKDFIVCDISSVELIEKSPLAPLLRVTCRKEKDIRIEYLIRFIPLDGIFNITRRITNFSSEAKFLRKMGMCFSAKNNEEWQVPGMYSGRAFKIGIYKHGVYSLDGEEKKGFPELLIKSNVYGLFLEKGWQRYPVEVIVENSNILLNLFISQDRGLLFWPGTSIRHNIMLSAGESATSILPLTPLWHWVPEYICSTNTMGMLAPRTDKSIYFFEGFESSVESAFNSLRRSRLDTPEDKNMGPAVPLENETEQAPEYFGLQHYGDWPLEWGRYGGKSPHHRIYVDNEYDIPFAFFQQFVRTGQWKYLDIARHGITHMADLDMDILNGKMFYHGYLEYGEDHNLHRATPGVGDHSFTEGLWAGYFIFGDIWAREAAEAIGRSLLKNFQGDTDDAIMRHWFICERTVGWPMIQLVVNAESNGDITVLKKVEQMTDFLLRYFNDPDGMYLKIDSFDGKKFKWFRAGAQDGSKTFMLSIVMEGLERYHSYSGDEKALECMRKIADFLIARMWNPVACIFKYELNAYNRGHRKFDPVSGIFPVRSLAYLYEKTGNELYRTVAKEAFFGAFWAMVSPGGTVDEEGNSKSIRTARELGIMMRSANAGLYWLMKWQEDIEKEIRNLMFTTSSNTWSFSGTPKDLLNDRFFSINKGNPVFLDNGALYTTPRFNRDGILIEDGNSYIYGSFKQPVSTKKGVIKLTVKNLWQGDEGAAVCQRGWLHLSDEQFTASALSIISFYGIISVRIYDAKRDLIDSLECDIKHWKAGEIHTVSVVWNERDFSLIVDNKVIDSRSIDRCPGGSFRYLSVGYHPAHWTFEGEILHISISLGKDEDR